MTNSILGDTFNFLFGPSIERRIRQAIDEIRPEPNEEEECPHEWDDEIETCRNCEGIDIQSVALGSNDPMPGVLHAPAEPIYGSFCATCGGLTMVSLASHCALCGEVNWVFDMDEEIFGGVKYSRLVALSSVSIKKIRRHIPMGKNADVKKAVLDKIFGDDTWEWINNATAYGRGKSVHVRCDKLQDDPYPFNIGKRALYADFELWICGSESHYYLVPSSDIEEIYNTEKAWVDQNSSHREFPLHIIHVDTQSNTVNYATGVQPKDLRKYRGGTVPGDRKSGKSDPGRIHIEGKRYEVVLSRSERSGAARDECLQIYGTACMICGCDFGKRYGKEFDGYIHVHHLQPMADNRDSHVVIPEKHLRPVCPNCHSVLHQRKPPLTIDDAKGMLGEDE